MGRVFTKKMSTIDLANMVLKAWKAHDDYEGDGTSIDKISDEKDVTRLVPKGVP
jgi:hypothetical protein